MKRKKNIYILFLTFLLLFVATTQYSQALALENFLIYSPLMQLLVFVIAVWMLVSSNNSGKNSFLSLFTMWMFYLIIRYFFSETGREQTVSVFRYSWYCTCFIAAFLCSKHICERIKIARVFIVLLFVVSISLTLLQLSLGDLVIAKSNEEGVLVTNIVFWVLCLLPAIFLFKNLNLQLFFLLGGSLVTLMTMKRSAIIVTVLLFALFVYSLIGKRSSASSSQKRIVIGLLLLVVVVAVTNFSSQLGDLFGTATTRFQAIEESEVNNRMPLWQDCIRAIEQSSLSEIIFGHGFKSTLHVAGHTSAHNDFLTLLLELGVIAVIFYISFIVKLIKRIIHSKKHHDDLFFVYLGITIVIVTVGMVGDLFTCYTYLGLLTSLLGITEAEYLQHRILKR